MYTDPGSVHTPGCPLPPYPPPFPLPFPASGYGVVAGTGSLYQ